MNSAQTKPMPMNVIRETIWSLLPRLGWYGPVGRILHDSASGAGYVELLWITGEVERKQPFAIDATGLLTIGGMGYRPTNY